MYFREGSGNLELMEQYYKDVADLQKRYTFELEHHVYSSGYIVL